jgi:hypothetical protein
MNKQRGIILIFSILGIIAAFLPHYSSTVLFTSPIEFLGVDMISGRITLAAFLASVIFCFTDKKSKPFTKARVLNTIAGLITVLITLGMYAMIDITKSDNLLFNFFGIGITKIEIGGYLTLAAGIGICVTSFIVKKSVIDK